MTEEEEEVVQAFTEEDQELLEMLRRKRLASDGGKKPMTEEGSTSSSFRDNFATYAHSYKGTRDTHAFASISTTRSPEWIVVSSVSRHVTGAHFEFSSLYSPSNPREHPNS